MAGVDPPLEGSAEQGTTERNPPPDQLRGTGGGPAKTGGNLPFLGVGRVADFALLFQHGGADMAAVFQKLMKAAK